MRTVVALLSVACSAPLAFAGESTAPAGKPYNDDPAITAILKGLDGGECRYLPAMKTAGEGMDRVHGFAKRGPNVRDYGNKLAYAPDRETAMYCGANHNVPHRINDVSEYHLGSNTWHLICPPGTDARRLRGLTNAQKKLKTAIEKGQDVEKNRAELARVEAQIKAWYSGVTVADGYLQDKANGGPIRPWHTWDGMCYDQQAGCLMWAVLDTDATEPKRRVQVGKTRTYARVTGQDPEKLVAQLKPSSSMYMYSPEKKRWRRQMGKGPFPFMRGMGGSLTYVPDIKKTVWYCAAQNVTPNDFAMWAYDAAANRWQDLKPNGGKSIRGLVFGSKQAPTGEVQMAYSAKHKKIVAVSKAGTWAYDIVKNEWKKMCQEDENKAHDARTVFAYDDNADVFLFLNAPDPWGSKRVLRGYDLKTNKWETITPKGTMVTRPKYCGNAGYYDQRHNVFVVYNSTPKVWVYRHRKTAAPEADKSARPGKSASPPSKSPKAASPVSGTSPAAPPAAPRTPTRTTEQVCTGWFSSAKNYRNVGLLADAKRCLRKIISAYPDTAWAARARQELKRL
jgi:hypothetical protein